MGRHRSAGAAGATTLILGILVIGLLAAGGMMWMREQERYRKLAAERAALAQELESQRLRTAQAEAVKVAPAQVEGVDAELARLRAELEEERAKALRMVARAEEVEARMAAIDAAKESAEEDEEDGATPEEEIAEARSELEKAITGKGLLQKFGSDEFRETLARLRQTLGAEGLETLLTALSSGTSEERLSAALLLEGWNDPAALPGLELAATQDKDGLVQRFSAHALAMIEGDAQLPVLARIVENAEMEPGARINAAYGMAVRGDERGMRFMIERDQKGDLTPDLQAALAPAIASAAEHGLAEIVLPYLHSKIVPDASVTNIYVGLSALEKVGDRSSLPALEALLTSEHPESLKDQARKVINKIEGYEKHPVN